MQQPLDHLPDEPNPYDFVPFEDAPTYVDAVPSLDRATGLSGHIGFRLITRTPVCIRQGSEKTDPVLGRWVQEFAHQGGGPVVPGTSLKGMLRGVHEVVTNSRMGVVRTKEVDHPDQGIWYLPRLPAAYLPGGEPKLTPTEALFGVIGGDGEDTYSRAGRVFIDDIRIETELALTEIPWPQGGVPDPSHQGFYFKLNQQARPALGRKFYYHQEPTGIADLYLGRGIHSRLFETFSGTLQGTVRFVNLTEKELGSLVYAIFLEDHLAHKLGYGRAYGFGSVRFELLVIAIERNDDDAPARFRQYEALPGQNDYWHLQNWTPRFDDLRELAKQRWLKRPEGLDSYWALNHILRWQTTQRYAYPKWSFFQDQPHTPLWEIQRRDTPYPGGEQRGNFVRVGARPPMVRANDESFYQLHEMSGEPEVVQRLRQLLDQGRVPRIRFRAGRASIEGQLTRVAMNVEIVAEG